MIDDHPLDRLLIRSDPDRIATGRVRTLRIIAGADSKSSDDHIVSLDDKTGPAQADPVSQCGLSRNSDIGMANVDAPLQINGTTHLKDDGPRSLGLAGLAKATGAGFVEVCDEKHLSAAAALCVGAKPFGAGEGQSFGRGRDCQ